MSAFEIFSDGAADIPKEVAEKISYYNHSFLCLIRSKNISKRN